MLEDIESPVHGVNPSEITNRDGWELVIQMEFAITEANLRFKKLRALVGGK